MRRDDDHTPGPATAMTCVISEIFEIHRDPGGHHHHGTLLSAYVPDQMRPGHPLLFPTTDGSVCAARVIDIRPAWATPEAPKGARKCLDIATPEGSFSTLMVAAPAPPGGLISSGEARVLGEEDFHRAKLDMLRTRPSLFFHDRGPDAPASSRCLDCAGHIPSMSVDETRQVIEALTARAPDAESARMALKALGHRWKVETGSM